jgi:biotin-dependent carboxylase-like uncharacterized protein
VFKVLSPGILTTFQDKGRFGYRHLGVPVCGIMDDYSATKSNYLAHNRMDSAVMECTIKGPVLQCISPADVVLSGIGFNSTINQKPIITDKLYKLQSGDILDIGHSTTGMRIYLAVRGGFVVEKILGSASYDKTVAPKLKLQKDQILETCMPDSENQIGIDIAGNEINFNLQTIEVFPGPEFDCLNTCDIKQLLNNPWTIDPSSSRMAILVKEKFVTDKPQIISAAVHPGCIQLTPSGKLILLMKDAQTTGGYARIMQVSAEGISILAQKVPGSQIFFDLKK